MSARPIYYDTETTGTKAATDFIVEIAAFDPERDKTFVSLVKPSISIPKEASAVHGITDEMVEDAPLFGDVAEEFISFCEGDVILIAHNNDGFDIHFLREEFKRAKKEMPTNWRFIDSLKWARRYRPDLPRHALQFLREIYQIEQNNAHRALDDVVVLHQVFSQMIDDLPIDFVYDLLNKKRELKHMPFGKHQGKLLEEIPKSYIAWLKDSGALEKEDNKPLLEALLQKNLIHT